MDNVIIIIEKLRDELERLITLNGLSHVEVLKLSQRLDKYISIHYGELTTNNE